MTVFYFPCSIVYKLFLYFQWGIFFCTDSFALFSEWGCNPEQSEFHFDDLWGIKSNSLHPLRSLRHKKPEWSPKSCRGFSPPPFWGFHRTASAIKHARKFFFPDFAIVWAKGKMGHSGSGVEFGFVWLAFRGKSASVLKSPLMAPTVKQQFWQLNYLPEIVASNLFCAF